MKKRGREKVETSFYTTNPLNYLNKDKLYKLTAQLTESSPTEVQRVVEYTFKNVKDWMREPYAKGGYFLPNFGTFSFNWRSAEKEIQKLHKWLRANKDTATEAEINKALRDRDTLRKRFQLGLEYDRACKKRGAALNKFRENYDYKNKRKI